MVTVPLAEAVKTPSIISKLPADEPIDAVEVLPASYVSWKFVKAQVVLPQAPPDVPPGPVIVEYANSEAVGPVSDARNPMLLADAV
jgi:hypothetical protein